MTIFLNFAKLFEIIDMIQNVAAGFFLVMVVIVCELAIFQAMGVL